MFRFVLKPFLKRLKATDKKPTYGLWTMFLQEIICLRYIHVLTQLFVYLAKFYVFNNAIDCAGETAWWQS